MIKIIKKLAVKNIKNFLFNKKGILANIQNQGID